MFGPALAELRITRESSGSRQLAKRANIVRVQAASVEWGDRVDEPHALGDIATAAAFGQALAATDEPPQLVVLNSCHSAGLIDDLVASIVPFAIGMSDEI